MVIIFGRCNTALNQTASSGRLNTQCMASCPVLGLFVSSDSCGLCRKQSHKSNFCQNLNCSQPSTVQLQMQRLCDDIHHQEPCRSAWRSWGEGHKVQKLWIIFVKLTVWWFWPLSPQGDRPLQLHARRLPHLVLPGPEFLTTILINFQESTKEKKAWLLIV